MFLKKGVVMMFRRDRLFGGLIALLAAAFLGGSLWALAEDKALGSKVAPDKKVAAAKKVAPSKKIATGKKVAPRKAVEIKVLEVAKDKVAEDKVADNAPKPISPFSLASLRDTKRAPLTRLPETKPAPSASKDGEAEEQEPELVTERYQNRVLKIERQMVVDDQFNYVNHGIYKEYDREGSLIRAGEYRMGKQEGRWIQYFKSDDGCVFSGKLSSEFQGPFVSEANFVDGQIHGTWTITSRTGRKVVEWQFDRGARQGRACWYHPNGERRREGHYERGMPVGTFHNWGPDGKLIHSVTYVDGCLLTKKIHWHNKNQKAYEGSVMQGRDLPEESFDWWNTTATSTLKSTNHPEQKHGRWVAWYPNGQTKIEAQYSKGKPVGKFSWWYENGQKQAQGHYADGLRTGTWTTWHQNGMKESLGEYANGVIAGRWVQWEPSGKVVKICDFSGESDENADVASKDDVKKAAYFDRIDRLEQTARTSMTATE